MNFKILYRWWFVEKALASLAWHVWRNLRRDRGLRARVVLADSIRVDISSHGVQSNGRSVNQGYEQPGESTATTTGQGPER